MIEFLSSLSLFGWIVLACAVLVLAKLPGVLRARDPRHLDREAREAEAARGGDRYAAVGTRSLIDPADPADPRG